MTALLKSAIEIKNQNDYGATRIRIRRKNGNNNQSLPDKVSKIFPFQKRLKKRLTFVPYYNNGSNKQSANKD